MPSVSIEVDGDIAVEHTLMEAALTAGAKAFTITRTWTQALTTKIRANASGRPGPRARTGDYRRSWSGITYVRGGVEVVGEASTNAPQGPRLEFGFTGVDALGRHYDQPPYPHARPALDAISEPYTAALAAEVLPHD
jgi:hypothetical protein